MTRPEGVPTTHAARRRVAAWRLRPNQVAVAAIPLFFGITLVASAVGLSVPTSHAGTVSPLLSDDFAHDASLNSSLWQINGSVAAAFGGVNCPGCANVTLAPTFSAAGMEIAQVIAGDQVGAIQSLVSLAPPFTVTALVEATVSNGHPFVFGVVTSGATAGAQITGNLNADDCSHESDCGDPTVCATPPNSSVPSGQCYYGLYGRIGSGGGSWPKTPFLNQSPSLNTLYTLRISVDASGEVQLNASAAGQLLGQRTGQVGSGPFYVIMAQSEGAPVPGPGPNVAYWQSIVATPVAPSPTTSSGSSPPASWWIVVVVVIVLILVLLVAASRRRSLTVDIQDAATHAPLGGVTVRADGPAHLAGRTLRHGRVTFRGVAAGDYAVRAEAVGFAESPSESVTVRRSVHHAMSLRRSPAEPSIPTNLRGSLAVPEAGAAPPTPDVESPTSSIAPPPSPAPAADLEDWGGPRIRAIIATFRAQGATSPATARTAEELGLSRLFVRLMRRRQGKTRVFIEIDGKYYLNERALEVLQGK